MLRTTTPRDRALADNEALVTIGSEEIAGPLDLQATVTSGQTGMPEWLYEDDAFTDLLPARTGFMAFKLRQTAGPFVPKLRLEIQNIEGLTNKQIREAKAKIIGALDLQRDLQTFYRTFSPDVLSEAFEEFPGLRLMRAWDPFEALISCILTQWSSVKGWNTVARRLRKSFGTLVRFPDGSDWYASPTPESIATARIEELRRCGTGFRAKYLNEAARMVVDGQMDLEEVRGIPYTDAKELLMEIPGVGTKVADCLLLYGYGMLEAAPVDVWMHRVIQKLYLKDKRISQRRAEGFLRERFGSWAGYAQLYLYHYARMRRII